MSRKHIWPIEQTVFIVKHYASMNIEVLAADLAKIGPARSPDSIYGKAKYLGLVRENDGRRNIKNIGHATRFSEGQPAPLRTKIITLFAEHQEQTISQLSTATGSTKSACWKVCEDLLKTNLIHIADDIQDRAVVYRNGCGKNHKPLPIPRPYLSPWDRSFLGLTTEP